MSAKPIVAGSALDQSADLVAQVETSRLETEPFDHVYVEGVFSPAYYRRLLDRLPDTARYRELTHRDAMQPDGHSARRKFYLLPEHVVLAAR